MDIRTKPHGYKEKVTDEELVSLVEAGVMNSVGDWLNSADMARERMKSTLEYGMLPVGHLAPQGVSQIVSSDTVEAVEGYLAIIAELMLNNNKIARFVPVGKTPTDIHNAKVASDMVNYCIFKQNDGWSQLNTWVKSALLWKNSIIRWDFIEDYDYKIEEYAEIDQASLDEILLDDNAEIVGKLEYEPKIIDLEDGTNEIITVYKDVRIRHKKIKSKVRIRNVHPESFRITRDAHSLDDAAFVGIHVEMTRSEIRKEYPEMADRIDWDQIGEGNQSWAVKYTEEQATRKQLAGQEYWMGGTMRELFPLEANRTVGVVECWMRVDRDGDGIAELKHLIVSKGVILHEEDVDCIPLACLNPFEIPYEFSGLSVADMTRPTTMASTAILRGFVENVYLTNYSPKLADPNVVDFSALQNMKPKQIIATNGNPTAAVAPMVPETISTGTVPLLELLQLHKEQAHGMGKAAQGLNDTLYVSGNSEEKMQQAMSAAQVRIQYMARRFAETGFKRLTEGVYKCIRDNLGGTTIEYADSNNYIRTIDPMSLPDNMLLWIDADVGENGNSNVRKKMEIVGSQLIPALQAAGAGAVVKPDAAVLIAAKTLEAMDLDPLDFMEDYTTPEFLEKATKAREAEQQAAEKLRQLEEQLKQLDIQQRQATMALTNIQSKNAIQDNTRQMIIAIDKHHQEWADLYIKAAKEGIEPPPKPDIMAIYKMVYDQVTVDASLPLNTPEIPQSNGPAAAVSEPQM